MGKNVYSKWICEFIFLYKIYCTFSYFAWMGLHLWEGRLSSLSYLHVLKPMNKNNGLDDINSNNYLTNCSKNHEMKNSWIEMGKMERMSSSFVYTWWYVGYAINSQWYITSSSLCIQYIKQFRVNLLCIATLPLFISCVFFLSSVFARPVMKMKTSPDFFFY